MNLWDRRIERAEELAIEYPAAAELLDFYRHIARFQKNRGSLESLLELLQLVAPPPLANAAKEMRRIDEWDPADPAPQFVKRVLQQAAIGDVPFPPGSADAQTCPICDERPVVAVLRPEGEGGKRSLVCSICFREWEFNRIRCPNCGEEDKDQLPVYTAEQYPHIRIEACDHCRTYIKSVDLTRNGLAIPEVDELASVALDLWAAGKGYAKMQPNLFGL